MLYYNKDLFDAAGVAYPSNDMTWDEYDALAAKMTSGEGSSKVYGGHNHTWQALVTNWAVQDGKHTVVDKDYSFLKPWYEAALSLQDNGYIQDYSTLKTANIHYSSVFKNQQCDHDAYGNLVYLNHDPSPVHPMRLPLTGGIAMDPSSG